MRGLTFEQLQKPRSRRIPASFQSRFDGCMGYALAKFYVITRAFRLPSGPGGWSHGCLKISRSILLVRVWRPSFFVVLALSGANMHRHKSVGWQPSWPVNLRLLSGTQRMPKSAKSCVSIVPHKSAPADLGVTTRPHCSPRCHFVGAPI